MTDPSPHVPKMNEGELERWVQELEEQEQQIAEEENESSEKGEDFEALESLEKLIKEIDAQEEEEHSEKGEVPDALKEPHFDDQHQEEQREEVYAEPAESTADILDATEESRSGRATTDNFSAGSEDEELSDFYWTDLEGDLHCAHIFDREQGLYYECGVNCVICDRKDGFVERVREGGGGEGNSTGGEGGRREARVAAQQARSMGRFAAAQARARLRERMMRAQAESSARQRGRRGIQVDIRGWGERTVGDGIKIRVGNEMREMNRQMGRDLENMRRDIEDVMAEIRRSMGGM
ncbi:hypothetical protein N431DRAFT_474636 [Stipitochalara longipes BDJ]|nr:hypothetical protein N431DRAFT_474636 [Stipitochalara longipes BDJ]